MGEIHGRKSLLTFINKIKKAHERLNSCAYIFSYTDCITYKRYLQGHEKGTKRTLSRDFVNS